MNPKSVDLTEETASFFHLRDLAGQQPDECLMKCTNDHYQNSPRTDPMTILRVQRLEVGNATVMCPTVNDTAQLDFSCA